MYEYISFLPNVGDTVSFTRTPSDYPFNYGVVVSTCKEAQEFTVKIPCRETLVVFHCACSWDNSGHFHREMLIA